MMFFSRPSSRTWRPWTLPASYKFSPLRISLLQKSRKLSVTETKNALAKRNEVGRTNYSRCFESAAEHRRTFAEREIRDRLSYNERIAEREGKESDEKESKRCFTDHVLALKERRDHAFHRRSFHFRFQFVQKRNEHVVRRGKFVDVEKRTTRQNS